LIGFVPSGSQFAHHLEIVKRLLQEGNKPEALDTFLRTVFEIIDRQLPHGAFESAASDLDIIFRLEAPAFQTWTFTVDDAKRIRQPILYVGGEDSVEYFQEVRALLSSWFPRMKELIIPKTNHMLHMMNPKPVAEGLQLPTFFTSPFLGRFHTCITLRN
jgi:pimeloyl-ACP methyl ester carboxylesterase